MSVENKAGPPQWFTRAIEDPGEDCFVNVEGCRIHYLRWGQAASPGWCFWHGGFAHAHWWDFIAPFFAEDYPSWQSTSAAWATAANARNIR